MLGSCLCGAIGFRIDGELIEAGHCHCGQCRKHHGAAFATFGTVKRTQMTWTRGEDHLKRFHSSETGSRVFCDRCGSSLLFDEAGDDCIYFSLGVLDDDPGIRASYHIYVASKAPWHSIDDDLAQYDDDSS